MPILKFQVAAAADSVLARDRIVNTLYFNVARPFGGKPDGDKLCADLASIFDRILYIPDKREIAVKAYEVVVGPDGPPVGEALLNKGLAPPSAIPREVSMCLSYYATRNSPRTRGRIYLFGGALTPIGVRPSPTSRTKALGLVPEFAALGGIDVNWVVHSKTSNTNPGVTDAWVDDEYDTVRSRGLRATTRTVVTTTG